MERKEPQIKLISKMDFDRVRKKYGFYSEDTKEEIEKMIESAAPLDVLALKVTLGSGLKIMGVRVLNENKEEEFIKLLKEGIPSD